MEDKHVKFQHQFHKVGLQNQIFEENTFSFPKADSSQLMEEVLVKTNRQTDRQKQAGRQTRSRWLRCRQVFTGEVPG